MIEIIKNILFGVALVSGSICTILLFLILLYRVILVFIDNMKNANVVRQCLMIYIHRKRPDIKIELEDIDIQKQGIHLNKKNKE
ncbi:MAG: hypothetical protein MR691_08050 [Clostridium sp.]|nr:hypothetical protein [Clostridium sp.]DAP68312.1 MAG TPA: hypothetical protein [Caudoviricetes sp.]